MNFKVQVEATYTYANVYWPVGGISRLLIEKYLHLSLSNTSTFKMHNHTVKIFNFDERI